MAGEAAARPIVCSAGFYGGKPSPMTCERACPHRVPRGDGAALQWIDVPLSASDVAHGIAGVAKALTGRDKASAETIAARLAVCATCEHRAAGVVTRCTLCGCALRLKLKLQGEKCPASKW